MVQSSGVVHFRYWYRSHCRHLLFIFHFGPVGVDSSLLRTFSPTFLSTNNWCNFFTALSSLFFSSINCFVNVFPWRNAGRPSLRAARCFATTSSETGKTCLVGSCETLFVFRWACSSSTRTDPHHDPTLLNIFLSMVDFFFLPRLSTPWRGVYQLLPSTYYSDSTTTPCCCDIIIIMVDDDDVLLRLATLPSFFFFIIIHYY